MSPGSRATLTVPSEIPIPVIGERLRRALFHPPLLWILSATVAVHEDLNKIGATCLTNLVAFAERFALVDAVERDPHAGMNEAGGIRGIAAVSQKRDAPQLRKTEMAPTRECLGPWSWNGGIPFGGTTELGGWKGDRSVRGCILRTLTPSVNQLDVTGGTYWASVSARKQGGIDDAGNEHLNRECQNREQTVCTPWRK
jgi:hypothetical protein